MLIDTAIKEFQEKYDREAMQSIDKVSREYGLNANHYKFDVFNIQESFNQFESLLRGYGKYKKENKDNPDAITQEGIQKNFSAFFSGMFKTEQVEYKQLPEFVSSYITGVKSLIETVDDVKRQMFDDELDASDIGAINEFTDSFMKRLQESFDPTMNRILWASGYNGKQRMADILKNGNKKETVSNPVFL